MLDAEECLHNTDDVMDPISMEQHMLFRSNGIQTHYADENGRIWNRLRGSLNF